MQTPNESMNLQGMAKAKDEKTINELNALFSELKTQNEIYKTTIVDVLQRIPRKSLLVYSTDGRQFPLSNTESGNEPSAHSEEAMHITESAHVYQVFMNHYKKERDIDEAAGYGIGVKIDEKLFYSTGSSIKTSCLLIFLVELLINGFFRTTNPVI